MIDTHCHLADAQFDADRAEVIARAHAAGVERMIAIADTLNEAEKCQQIAQENEHIFYTVGVHPHHASSWCTGDDERVRALIAASPKAVAVGEIGLDYHYDRSPRDVQRAVFREQLLIAKEHGLPSVIHCREAVEDVWAIVAEVAPPPVVLHCCTERWGDVERFVARGDMLSFTGIATYATADEIRRTIRQCPVERLMIETDAPYLAPAPHRGKRNEPAFVVEVARCIAQERGMTVEEVIATTTRNAMVFFRWSS